MLPCGFWWFERLSFMNPNFQKSNIGWPQQLLAEKMLRSVKNWIFDDAFHKNGQELVPGMIQSSESGSSLME